MDYRQWAEEYFAEAIKIKEVINKYKQQLKTANPVNRELINANIHRYKTIYYDLMDTGNILLSRHKED